jgi:hypothetical protein
MKIEKVELVVGFDGAKLIIHSKDKSALNRVYESVQPINHEKDYTLSLKRTRVKRSLDANAYMWKLLSLLAEKLSSTPIELYKFFVRQYGQAYIVPIKEEAINAYIGIWESNGIGWFAEDLGECRNTEGYHNVKTYYGTSQYDTKQMSRLLDQVVYECKEQGIETLPPAEIKRLFEGEKRK